MMHIELTGGSVAVVDDRPAHAAASYAKHREEAIRDARADGYCNVRIGARARALVCPACARRIRSEAVRKTKTAVEER